MADDDALAVALLSGLPFVGLRGFSADARLWRYLPPALARSQRAVPVLLVGDVLQVAADDPACDLSRVSRAFPHLQIALHLARPAELDAVLARLDVG